MSVYTRIVLDVPGLPAADLNERLRFTANAPRRSFTRLVAMLQRIAGGFDPAILQVNTNAVKAAATLTFTDDPTADETFVLCGVTFTGKASGASGDEWNITTGGSAAADAAANAASVVTVVNANTTVNKCVIATSSLGVVTFTALVPGAFGNGFVLTESMTNATRVQFTGGSDGTAHSVTLT